MSAPRLEIDLDKIYHNARTLVERLAKRGISVAGVTKATLGSAEIADTLLRAGVSGLGDSRIENIEAMRKAGVVASMALIRSPMLSQVDRVVRHCDVSFNTELDVIKALSLAGKSAEREHGIVLMVELGDLREGIMPEDLPNVVRETLRLPNISILGIGANLACRSGVSPDDENMAQLSELVELVEKSFGLEIEVVSGGNSASLDWALSAADVGCINHLRLGESIFLGCEPLHRRPLVGLHTDAVTLVAEVIESKLKPTRPWGEIGQTAFGGKERPADRGHVRQAIAAVGVQDTDPLGLSPPPGIEIQASSSDHLILESSRGKLEVGAEIEFQLNYSALVRAMTSPFVVRVVKLGSARPAGSR